MIRPRRAYAPPAEEGVLIGIGFALLLQRWWDRSREAGLGTEGVIAIDLYGAGMLIAWLITSGLSIPTRGYVFLWAVAVLVWGVCFTGIAMRVRKDRQQQRRATHVKRCKG